MSWKDELKSNILNSVPDQVKIGRVLSVDEKDMTCRIAMQNGGPNRLNVRLRAAISDDKGFLAIPALDSYVLVGIIDSKPAMSFVVATTVLREVRLTVGTSKFMVNENGYSLGKGDETIEGLLDEMLTAIQQLTVTTGTGPSGVPINATSFADIQTRFKDLLNAAQ